MKKLVMFIVVICASFALLALNIACKRSDTKPVNDSLPKSDIVDEETKQSSIPINDTVRMLSKRWRLVQVIGPRIGNHDEIHILDTFNVSTNDESYRFLQLLVDKTYSEGITKNNLNSDSITDQGTWQVFSLYPTLILNSINSKYGGSSVNIVKLDSITLVLDNPFQDGFIRKKYIIN